MGNLVVLTKENLNDYKNMIFDFINEIEYHTNISKDVLEKARSKLESFKLENDVTYCFNTNSYRQYYVLFSTAQTNRLSRVIANHVDLFLCIEKATMKKVSGFIVKLITNNKFIVEPIEQIEIETDTSKERIRIDRKDIFSRSVFKQLGSKYLTVYPTRELAEEVADMFNRKISEGLMQAKLCIDCGQAFILDAKDLLYFDRKNFKPHQRCHDCRLKRKNK